MQFSRMMLEGNQRKGTGNHALKRYAKMLMTNCNIPHNLPSYSFERYVRIVQDYYDRTYPGKYRVSVFSTVGSYKPLYVSEVEHYEHDVSILYDAEAEHYDGIRTINRLFGSRFYCIDCARPFSNVQEHTSKCVRKCSKCGTMGPDRPCQSDGGTHVQCDGCNKQFDNRSCYERHKASMCKRYKKCLDCGVLYDMQNIERFSDSGKHECDYKLCLMCNVFHQKGQDCFMSPLAVPEPKDARFCFFDIESTQDTEMQDSKRKRYRHECNAVHASIVCTRCIAKNIWKSDDTRACEICGPKREYWWSEAEGCAPMTNFLNTLLYGFNSEYPTYVLGHFSGRYDMHAVNKEM